MALNLKAVFELQDRGTAKMQRIIKQTEKLEKATDNMTRSNNKATSALSKFGGGIGKLAGGAGRLVSSLNPAAAAMTAVGVAAAGAYGSVKLFNATVGKAMQAEVGEISIGAMFDTQGQTDAYLKMIKKMSLESPVLSYQDMAGGSKKLLTLTRDAKILEKTWKNVEKLQAYMPDKSTEDAMRGIAELASGDIVSLKEVFNLDKKQLNALKNLTFEEQVDGLEKMLAGMKITDKFIARIGDTASAKWNQVKEKFDDILTTIGKPSLDVLSNFFDGVLTRLSGEDMQKFASWGANIMSSVVTGLSNSATKLYDYFTQLSNNPEFKQRTTLSGKVDFLITDIAAKLQAWYDGGGKDKLESFAKVATETIISALNASQEFANVGSKMGAAVWQGVIDGVKASATQNPLGKVINGFLTVTGVKGMWEDHQKISDIYKKKQEEKKGKPKYHGIDNVPYDGYAIRAHKNERVLTAQENKEYTAAKEGKGGFGGGVTITGNTFNVREEADIEKVAYKLALLIESEAMQIGY